MGSKTAATATASANGVDQNVALDGTGIQTQLSASPASVSFGSKDIDDGQTAPQDVTVTNTGTETVTLSSNVVSGDFQQVSGPGTNCVANTLAAGDSCELWLEFDPSATGARSGNAVVHSNAPDLTVPLDGTGTQTSLSSSALTSFGSKDIDDGATATQTSTVTNTGTEAVDVSGVGKAGSDPSQFVLLSGQPQDCSTKASIGASQTCEVRVQFDPSSTGAKSAKISIPSRPEADIALSGTGIQTQLSPSPTTLPFGDKDIDDGAAATQESTVTNSGTEAVTISGVDVTGDYTQLTGDSADCVNGKVLAAADTCKLRVLFDPTATGARNGSATVHSNAPDASVTLTGSGHADGAVAQLRQPGLRQQGHRRRRERDQDGDRDEQRHGAGELLGDRRERRHHPVRAAHGRPQRLHRHHGSPPRRQACQVRFRFDPTTTGSKAATVTVSSNAPAITFDLTGAGIQTSLSSSPLTSFGNKDIDDGATATQTSTVTNTGTEAVDVSGVGKAGSDPTQFVLLSGQPQDCSTKASIGASQTCEVRVQFDPSSTGAKSAKISIPSRPEADIALSGAGIQTSATRSPGTLSFGSKDIDDGATAAQDVTVTNTGTQAIPITSIAATGDFAQVAGAGTNCSTSTNLTAGQSCKIHVAFDPASTGAKTGTLTVKATGVPDLTVALDGNGIQTLLSSSPGSLSYGSQDVDDGPTARAGGDDHERRHPDGHALAGTRRDRRLHADHGQPQRLRERHRARGERNLQAAAALRPDRHGCRGRAAPR